MFKRVRNIFGNDRKEYLKTSGYSESFWVKDTPPMLFSKLKKNMEVDVIVVGGGITGVTTAYFLMKEGKKVALIEDGAIGSGETGRTTAHLTWVLDDRYYHIENLHGIDNAKLAYDSHKTAIDTIERIVKKEKIKCDFERLPGYLYHSTNDPKDTLQEEYDCLKRMGVKGVEFVGNAPLKSYSTGPALKFLDQAQFHPLKYIFGLCKILKRNGCLIFTETHVRKTKEDRIITDDGLEIKARKIVIATGSPIKGGKIFYKQAAYRTYVVAATIPRSSVETCLLWNTGDKEENRPYPYHYVRTYNLNKKEDLLIVGGEDHKTGQPHKREKPYKNLESWVKTRFPNAKKFVYEWSGQIIEPVDSLAFIGSSPWHKNIYIATGDSGNGMTHGTIAGILITDLIMGRKNMWADLYDPDRKTPLAIRPWIREGRNFVVQYLDYIKKGDLKNPHELSDEEGAVIRKGATKLAVYKDEKGKIHSYSAVCTHQGCLVKWNKAEKTFDCPCHGSRFSCKGRVLNGPATKPLEPKKWEE